jgi:hypothetical protein
MKRLAVMIAALALVAIACGESSGTGTPTTTPPTTVSPPTTTQPPKPTTTAPTTTTVPPDPIDPDQRILVVHRGGGLVPPEFLLDRLPLYTLYADGRLAYEGARPAIFPGPLLPAIVQVDIGDDGLSKVMAAIVSTGLPDITEVYNHDAINQVADGPQTEVSYFDDNGEHFFSVYALDIADHKNRKVLALKALMTLLDRLTATSPDAGPFTIERLQVIVSSQTADPSNPLAIVEQWPLSMAVEEMDEFDFALRCAVVSVDDEPSAFEAFTAAHQMTFFEEDEIPYRLTVRPLLVGEPGCEPRER